MHQHELPKFDPARYPRTYRLSRGTRRLMVPVGILVLAVSAGGAIYFGFLTGDLVKARVVRSTLCTFFAILGLYVALSAFKYRVVLEANRIKAFGALQQRQLDRDKIAGRRHFVSGSGSARWILVPATGHGRKLELSMFLQTDRDFTAWILSLPDLDHDRKAAEQHEIAEATVALKERGYGEREQRRLRQIATWLDRGTYGLGAAIFFVPDPYNVLLWVAVAWPWLVIAAVAKFHPFYRFGGPRKNALPDLSLSLFIPGCFLTLSALTSMSTVDWQLTLALTIFGGIILAGAAIFVDPWLRGHPGTAAIMAILCCGYGYGAGLEANALLDSSTPTTFPVTVISKHVSHGKSTTYHLGIAAWGPRQSGDDVIVSGPRYRTTQIGDTVCILLRPGALKVGWYTLTSCEQQ